MHFKKPTPSNLSQGARLEYVRRLRHMDMDDVADYFGFRGYVPRKTFISYENNYRYPSKERLKDIAELYEVSINAMKEYDFSNKIGVIYNQIWLDEGFHIYEVSFDTENYVETKYNEMVQNVINE